MGVPIWKPSDQLDCDNANSKRRRVESTSQESHQARLRDAFVRTSTARSDESEGDSINLENTQNHQEDPIIPMRSHVSSDYRETSFRIPSSFFDFRSRQQATQRNQRRVSIERDEGVSITSLRSLIDTLLENGDSAQEDFFIMNDFLNQNNDDEREDQNTPDDQSMSRRMASMIALSFINIELGSSSSFPNGSQVRNHATDNTDDSQETDEPIDEIPSVDYASNQQHIAETKSESEPIHSVSNVEPLQKIKTFHVASSIRTVPNLLNILSP